MSLAGNVDPTDDAYTGSASAPPPLSATMNLVAKTDAVPSTASDVFIQVDIKFYVEFFNPLTVATS